MATASPARLRDDITRLAHRGLDVRAFSLASAEALGRAVPFDGLCVVTVDPATLLPTGEVVVNGLPGAASARLTEIEVREPDFIKFSALSRSPRRAASLSAATGGDLVRSRRHRELKQPHGFGDELRAALVADSGTWGGLTLLRAADRPPFTPADTRLVAAVAGDLAEGVRRAVLLASLAPSGEPHGHDEGEVGLLLLADDNSVVTADPTARMWLADLRPGAHLPPVVTAVASRARSHAAGDARGTASPARARARTASGRWLLVHGSVLGEGPTPAPPSCSSRPGPPSSRPSSPTPTA